ncbi:MAG: hypothetical protein HKN44_00255 [Ilumatobacter sp.]|nr:hypothetical protein [Ilumatobacter sp.]
MDEAARGELERLRQLVGPSETSYAALLTDREQAAHVAREALAETGELRGRVVELGVQLARARQDQDLLLRRAEMRPLQRARDTAGRWWAASVAPQLRRLPRAPAALVRRVRARRE